MSPSESGQKSNINREVTDICPSIKNDCRSAEEEEEDNELDKRMDSSHSNEGDAGGQQSPTNGTHHDDENEDRDEISVEISGHESRIESNMERPICNEEEDDEPKQVKPMIRNREWELIMKIDASRIGGGQVVVMLFMKRML